MTFAEITEKAKQRGWKTPTNDAFGEDVWLRYWDQCARHEADPTTGRPVVPHR